MIILQANKFLYEKGGSERYVFALSRVLEERGHRVVHFGMAHPRNHPSPYSRHFVSRREYDGPASTTRSARAVREFIRSREAAARLSGLLDEVRPDVAHLHNIYHQLTPSIIDVLARRHVPMVMTLHDYKLVCPSYALFARGDLCYRCRGGRFYRAPMVGCAGSRTRSGLLALESYWQRWTRVYDRVDRLVAPSQYLRGVMVDAGIDAGRVVYVAPLNPSSGEAPAGAEDRALLDALPERFVAYVGRLSAEKGVRVLVDAMAYAPAVPLVIFGEGPDEAGLRERAGRDAGERVHFAGHVTRATLNAALRRTVAVVLPTLSPENAPMTILEAADAGVPVIVSDRGGLPELAARVGGTVVPAHATAALADAIRTVWDHREEATRRAHAAWQEARDTFNADTHARTLENLYAEVCSTRRMAA